MFKLSTSYAQSYPQKTGLYAQGYPQWVFVDNSTIHK